MPQKPGIDDWQDVGVDDWQDVPTGNQPHEATGLDWWVEQALGTIPAVAGSLIGGATGFFGAGLGAIPGAMAGGAAGSAIGNTARQWYHGDDFNPYELGVETALGAVPPIFGAGKAAGMGAGALAKYATKQALSGAAEGALVGAGATPFEEWAHTGNFVPSWESVKQSAGAGALMGGVMGGGFGALHGRSHQDPNAYYQAPTFHGEPPPAATPPLPREAQPMPRLVADPRMPGAEQQQLFGEPIPPTRYDPQQLMLEMAPHPPTEVQENLPYGAFSWGNAPGPFARPGEDQFQLPFDPNHSYEGVMTAAPLGEVGRPNQFNIGGPTMEDMAPRGPRTPPPDAPVGGGEAPPPDVAAGPSPDVLPTAPEPSRPSSLPVETNATNHLIPPGFEVVTVRPNSPGMSQQLASEGYTPWSGHRGQGGFAQMIRRIAPAQEAKLSPFEQHMRDKAEGSTPNTTGEPITFNEEDGFTVSKDKITKSRIDSLVQQGFEHTIDKNGDSFFIRSSDSMDEPAFQRADDRIRPDEFRRGSKDNFEVYNTNTDKVHSYWPTEEMARRASEKLYNMGLPEMDYRPSPTRTPGRTIPFDRGGDEGPAMQAVRSTRTGGLKIAVDVPRAAANITRDYTSPLSGIMVRESMQNALDAADKLGANGHVKVKIVEASGSDPGRIEVHDNGSGLDQTALDEKLATLFATGKEGEEGASGGKGIGSASYMLGGDHFTIDTVAIDSVDGKKYRIIASGTPQEFLDQKTGSSWKEVQVPDDTPTGTTITTILKGDQESYNARLMVDNVMTHTRNRPSKVTVDKYGGSGKTHVSKLDSLGYDPENFKPTSGDKVIGDFTYKNNDVKIQIPTFDPDATQSGIDVHYLNNGMYQFTERVSLGESIKGAPDHVLVDVHPLVDDAHPDYPFINTREDMKKEFKEVVDKYIMDNIAGPEVERKKNRVQELYDSMTHVLVPGATRSSVVFDPGNRLTPEEMDKFSNHPIVRGLVAHYDKLLNDIIGASGNSKWANRLEGVGIVLDPGMNGVHIPNPTTKKSTILINPFLRASQGVSPKDNAFANTITNLHEVAHIGDETGPLIQLRPEDYNDPRTPEFLLTYMNQLSQHGDVGYKNTGHGMGFAHRLGDVYGKFGVTATYDAADALEHILTGGKKSGGYSPEFQRLLQLYTESRGRTAVTEDLLSGTGVKQRNQGRSGAGGVLGNSPQPGNGTAPQVGQKKLSIPRELYNLTRAATTTADLSAPLRQGIGLITRKEWWKSWVPMVKSLGSEGAYQKTLADLKNRKIFQSTEFEGKVVKSFADMAGMKLMDVGTNLSRREEAVASNWIETGGFLGKDNLAQKGYQNTFGRVARASNRAYTAFLNQLRADSFESLLKDAERDFNAKVKGAKNPYTDLTYAKEIADFVNTATGRGPLRTALPSVSGGTLSLKERSLEQNAKLLTDTIFSPRLMASRVRMLNPATYMMASPFVRKQYLRSIIGVAGAWGTVAALGKMAGADVSMDTNSADFGKLKIGNTRLDAGAGFQQYLATASRLITGHTTSSATQRDFELGQGYQARTRLDVAHQFAANKLHPVIKFAHDLLDASQYQPFSVADRTAQMFVPLIIGDVMDIAKEDPTMIPWMTPLVAGGMGTQTYEKGGTPAKIIPHEYDYNFRGGELPNPVSAGMDELGLDE